MATKRNFWSQVIGSMNALMKFGGLSPKGDVTSSWSVTGLDGRHFITFDEDGERTGYTLMNSPGATFIHAGKDLKRQDETVFILAHQGDIHLKASNGKIRMEGNSIEMVANGTAGEGSFWVKATERVKIDSKNITVDATQSLKLVSTGVLGIKGKPIDIIGSLITGVSKATNPNIKIGEPIN